MTLQAETLIVEPDVSPSLYPRCDFPPEALTQRFGTAGYYRDSLVIVMREGLVNKSTQIGSAGEDWQVAASGGRVFIVSKQLLLFFELDAIIFIDSSRCNTVVVVHWILASTRRGSVGTSDADLQPLDKPFLFALIRRNSPSDLSF